MPSGWREKTRARKKNWSCLKTASLSPLWRLFQVVWRSPHTIYTSMMAAARGKRQRKVRHFLIKTIAHYCFFPRRSSHESICISRNWVWFQEASVSAQRSPSEALQPAAVCAGAVLHRPDSLLHQLQKEGETPPTSVCSILCLQSQIIRNNFLNGRGLWSF